MVQIDLFKIKAQIKNTTPSSTLTKSGSTS